MTTRPRLLVIAAALLLGVLGLAPPAHGAPPPPDQWGFGYVDKPTAPLWTLLDPAHQATSLGTTVDGGKLGPGHFMVRFNGLGSATAPTAGNVHVTAVDPAGHYCETVTWFSFGSGVLVEVRCFAPGGVADDSKFTVLWTLNVSTPSSLPGSFASAQFVVGTGVVQSYHSAGVPVDIKQIDTGAFYVRFNKVGAGGSRIGGNVQVTALNPAGAPRWCKVTGWDPGGADLTVLVGCFDATGARADTDFTTSYHRERPVVSALLPPKYLGYVWTLTPLPGLAAETNFNYLAGGFGLNTLTPNGSGHIVTFPTMAVDRTHAQVTAFGGNANYCTLGKPLSSSGLDLIVYSRCYTPAGIPVQDDALVTATNRS